VWLAWPGEPLGPAAPGWPGRLEFGYPRARAGFSAGGEQSWPVDLEECSERLRALSSVRVSCALARNDGQLGRRGGTLLTPSARSARNPLWPQAEVVGVTCTPQRVARRQQSAATVSGVTWGGEGWGGAKVWVLRRHRQRRSVTSGRGRLCCAAATPAGAAGPAAQAPRPRREARGCV